MKNKKFGDVKKLLQTHEVIDEVSNELLKETEVDRNIKTLQKGIIKLSIAIILLALLVGWLGLKLFDVMGIIGI